MSETAQYQADTTGTYRPTGAQPSVRFERIASVNRAKSEDAGAPVYDAVTVLRVQHPGENDETVIAATPQHRRDYPRQWAAFEAGQAVDQAGIPLPLLFPAHPEIVEMLRSRGVHTVEQLAGLSGNGVANVGMGAGDWQRKAQDYIENARSGAPLHRLEAELARKAEETEAMKAEMADLRRQVAEMARPRKKETAE